ncbi:hypothetical protein ACFSZS_24710 [Seohaeicola zhoushanensis]
MTDIADLGAVALAAEIAAGRISPVEAVEAALARIYDRAELNAFVTVCADEAREAARAAEAAVTRGTLWGRCTVCPSRSRT